MHGLGGVGKTRLAVEYAWQHAEQFSAVLFVTADTPATLRQNLAEMTGPQKNDRGRHILPTDQSDAQCIARELDGLALALEQAGAYICRMRISLADYLARWKSHERKVQTWHDRTMNYSKPIDITWQTSLDQLSTDEVALLNILAWLSPDPIPLDIIEHLSPESLSSLRSLWPIPALDSAAAIDMRDLLADLADFSMIRWDAQKDEITVHRVVQEILRTQQQEPVPVLTAALNMLAAAIPKGNPADVRIWPQWNLLRPHVAFAATAAAAEQRGIDDPTSDLMGYLGQLLSGKALHSEAERWKRNALTINERAHGPDSTQVAMLLNNRAQTIQATNPPAEAEPLMRRALAIFRTSLGNEHPSTLTVQRNLDLLLDEMK